MSSPTDPAATRDPAATGDAAVDRLGAVGCGLPRRRRLLRLLAVPTVVWLAGSLLIAAGFQVGILSAVAARESLWVGAVCFAASVASLLPVGVLVDRPTAQLPLGLLSTVIIRGGVTVMALIGSMAAGWIDGGSVAISLSLWYAALLAADLVAVAGFLSQAIPLSVRPDAERRTC